MLLCEPCMADAESRGDEDNILAQLLPGTAVSSQGFVEEDEEEVKYSDTDEDFQPIEPSGTSRRELSHAGQAQEARWALLKMQHSQCLAIYQQRQTERCQQSKDRRKEPEGVHKCTTGPG